MAGGPSIERTFTKRECIKFIGSPDSAERCGCGRSLMEHSHLTQTTHMQSSSGEKWNASLHTRPMPTDAFGMLEFQGPDNLNKAQYIRLSSDTQPDSILTLFLKSWRMERPKLLISIYGGLQNFELQPKLKRMFSQGLRKAAHNTGAWIFTGGTNTGVTVHVGDALDNRSVKLRGRIVTVGIAPWGVLHDQQQLLGLNAETPYYSVSIPSTRGAILNSSHTHFLLADNGTAYRYGSEMMLRHRLEKHISQLRIDPKSSRCVPVVCVLVEGGPGMIRTILSNIIKMPPIPVVVCDGSGRAADLLAFTHKYVSEDGTKMPDYLRDQLLTTIQRTFSYNSSQAQKLFAELMMCMRKKDLITVYRMGEQRSNEDIDHAILTSILKCQNNSIVNQLDLTLTWNRIDIAKQHIFIYGHAWPEDALEKAMMKALMNDRVDFVSLLMDNGINMRRFLNLSRLEELYNAKLASQSKNNSILKYIAEDIRKDFNTSSKYTLYDIGLVIEHLMGGLYHCSYTSKKFRSLYTPKKSASGTSAIHSQDGTPAPELFSSPFNELFAWAVLTERQPMALFMCQQAEECLAKSLVGMKLYKAMAHEASHSQMDTDIVEQLSSNARVFQKLSMELLDQCYKQDEIRARQVLTYELKNWSKLTCISLAVAANHKEFVAHTCCQTLLNDMWMGGLQMRRNPAIKVILGILCPPLIFCLEFKSRHELQHMPQTMEEHIDDLQEDSEDDKSQGEAHEVTNSFNAATGSSFIALETVSGTGERAAASEKLMPGVHVTHNMSSTSSTYSTLKPRKKLYEFYNAPITKFYAHSMAYLAFLALFNYVVLIKMEAHPNVAEWIVISYIISLSLEKGRELMTSEPTKLEQKFRVWFSDSWNIFESVAILVFLIGMVLRLNVPGTMDAGRVIYCVNIIFWYIKILDIFSVNKYLGPYVTMIGKMMLDMCYFLSILVIVLMSFGVARHSILNPDQEPSWKVLREVFYQPYFMLYGEVFAGEIDPECDVNGYVCQPGHWVTPIIMALYLLVANILLINLLIAVFNNTYSIVNSVSGQVWKFQRYRLIMEYEQMPFLAPPLIIISHAYLLLCYMFSCTDWKGNDRALRLFLPEDELEMLQDFEEECVENYTKEKQNQLQSSTENKIDQTTKWVENMTLKLDEVNEREIFLRNVVQQMDERLLLVENMCSQAASSLKNIERAVLGKGPQNVLASVTTAKGLTSVVAPAAAEGNREGDEKKEGVPMAAAAAAGANPAISSAIMAAMEIPPLSRLQRQETVEDDSVSTLVNRKGRSKFERFMSMQESKRAKFGSSKKAASLSIEQETSDLGDIPLASSGRDEAKKPQLPLLQIPPDESHHGPVTGVAGVRGQTPGAAAALLQPQPYVSAPAYSSITDDIDTRMMQPTSPLTAFDLGQSSFSLTNAVQAAEPVPPPSPTDYDIHKYSSSRGQQQQDSQEQNLRLAEECDYEIIEATTSPDTGPSTTDHEETTC